MNHNRTNDKQFGAQINVSLFSPLFSEHNEEWWNNTHFHSQEETWVEEVETKVGFDWAYKGDNVSQCWGNTLSLFAVTELQTNI